MANIKEQLKVLHVKRSSIKSQITLFEKVLASIEQLFDSFNEVQSEFECLTYETQDTYNQEINECKLFQDSYFSLVTKAKILVNSVIKQGQAEPSRGQSSHSQTNMRTAKVYTAIEFPFCVNCKQQRVIQNCESFLKLDAQSRNKRARELKVCLNCLRGGHFLSNCNSRSTCKKFHRKHHTLIHLEVNKANETIPIPQQIVNENTITDTSNETNSTTSLSLSTLNAQTLLSTAIVKVNDTEHNSHQIRVLLDSASQSNFVAEGIGQGTINISHKVMLTFYSCCNNYKGIISCLVVPQISSALPTHTFNRNAIEIPPNIKLADSRFNESRPIDVLLGA
ncbi:hypothetical protein ILUMI_26223, partial [Ignelater luminosus]